MASQNLYNGRMVVGRNPAVYSDVNVNYDRRNANDMYVEVIIDEHCGGRWDWRNNRWAVDVSVNGQRIATNMTVKGVTSGTIGTTNYRAVATGTVGVGAATDVWVTIHYYDTGYGTAFYEDFSTQNAILSNIPSLPSCGIGINQAYPNKTDTSVKVDYSVSGWSDFVSIWVNGQGKGDFRGSPAIVTGLSPNTEYTVVARAHGSAGFGNESNKITFRTYKTPSTVSQAKVDDIEPFTCSAYIMSSDSNNTSKYEYALCDENKTVIGNPYETNVSYYDFTGLNEETSYYIRCRVQSKDSGAWSDYVYSPLFKTPADQVRAWAKINDGWNIGKAFVKVDGVWLKAKKAYVKIDGEWILSINKYD